MSRFWGNHSGTRQTRGFRRVNPATPKERLASMERELANRKRIYGVNHWLTQMQRDIITGELSNSNNRLKG